ncbi:SPFH domain-containing protein [Paenibacillus sp. y28]|uniref:SPFH domain-containing protein n=1 Tax=Paenibacillus sp. y28 TaxID=3129110 RepID=UPI00301A845D
MALLDVVKYDGPSGVLAWKYPKEDLGTWTQLIVHETQEAILFKGGQALDSFGAGRHTLATQNIPLLSSLVNLPFGGKSPFSAEVWFINKVHTLDIKWGTPSPIQLQDPKYQLPISVRAFGQFGVQIENARKFLLKLNGTLPMFDAATLNKFFSGVLLMNINKLISGYLVHKRISMLDINAYVGDISVHMEEQIAPIFEEYGIKLLNFNVLSINIPENDSATKRLKDALAKRAEMDILGYTYQQERTFDTLEEAARSDGPGSSVMDAGIGMGMGFSIGGGFGEHMVRLVGQLDSSPQQRACPACRAANRPDAQFCNSCGHSFRRAGTPQEQSVTCGNCKMPFPRNSKFCPHCGDPYHPCPGCKTDNPKDAVTCAACGTALNTACRQCGMSIVPGAKFCSECGTSTVLHCGQCRTEVKPGQKFCLECGHKLS